MVKYLLLLLTLHSSPPLKNIYRRHIQYCSIVYVQDRSWKLELQKDSVYVMEAEGFGGKRSQRDPLLRTTGAYKVNGDTLRLVPRGTHYQYAYLIKQGKLLAINPYSETIRGYTYTVTFFE